MYGLRPSCKHQVFLYSHKKKDDPSDLKALVMSPEVDWCVRCDRSGDRILQHYATSIAPRPLFYY
jgi:hypothetical protein